MRDAWQVDAVALFECNVCQVKQECRASSQDAYEIQRCRVMHGDLAPGSVCRRSPYRDAFTHRPPVVGEIDKWT